ncbi:MAG: prepilin peptidase [Candidatus Saccharibacteria bacterium]|nr:prepilin peptidase [Candidatus Saccharibacteria bacterium]
MDIYRGVFLVLMFIFGAGLGSFACCQAWRIKLKGKVKVRGGEEVSGKKKTASKKKAKGETVELGKRSVCLSCGHKLSWSENIPILSWILQRGKCRKCGAKIGKWEIIAEILMGILVVGVSARFIGFFRETEKCGMTSIGCSELSIDFWTMPWYVWVDIVMFIIMLVFMTEMMIVFIYDARWGRMPERELLTMIILALAYFLLRNVTYFYSVETIWDDFVKYDLPMIGSCLGGVAILAGIYFALYKASGEQLVGSGDYLLCLAVALVIGNWFLALIILFLSNFLASVVMIPGMIQKKKHMSTKVAFGPFVIMAFMIVYIFQDLIGMGLYSKLYY